jgi:hypothetical protein
MVVGAFHRDTLCPDCNIIEDEARQPEESS